jgi:hypothetical protein
MSSTASKPSPRGSAANVAPARPVTTQGDGISGRDDPEDPAAAGNVVVID